MAYHNPSAGAAATTSTLSAGRETGMRTLLVAATYSCRYRSRSSEQRLTKAYGDQLLDDGPRKGFVDGEAKCAGRGLVRRQLLGKFGENGPTVGEVAEMVLECR